MSHRPGCQAPRQDHGVSGRRVVACWHAFRPYAASLGSHGGTLKACTAGDREGGGGVVGRENGIGRYWHGLLGVSHLPARC